MKNALKFFFLLISAQASGQKQNNIWCFGDSAGIDFNGAVPIPISTSLDTRGSCVSFADSNGQLLFYSSYDADVYTIGGPPFNGGEVWNNQHQMMQNGDSLVMGLWYHEVVALSDPGNSNQYYIFCIGVTGNYGLWYSIVDIAANGGLGQVITKNVQLQSFKQVDCLSAVKHGNGRDWWIVFRKYQQAVWNNDFYTYLITPSGISNVTIQSVGSVFHTGLAKISFSPYGNKLLFTDYGDLIEMYDFNRCTGIISNPSTINPEATGNIYYKTWGSEFSPSGDLIYVSTSDTVSYLFQYNLNDSNPQATRDTLWSTNYPQYTGGDLKRAPDGKIYFSCAYDNQIVFNYPYPDSMRNMYNENLGVINSPDVLGVGCNFQPWSFYLGGKRTYWGLPNNPDYDLGCDTTGNCGCFTGIQNIKHEISSAEMFVTYISEWQKLFVNAQNIKGKNCLLEIFDVNGRIVFSSEKKTAPPYFTMDVNCAAFANGMYVVSLQTEKEKLVKKFVKE